MRCLRCQIDIGADDVRCPVCGMLQATNLPGNPVGSQGQSATPTASTAATKWVNCPNCDLYVQVKSPDEDCPVCKTPLRSVFDTPEWSGVTGSAPGLLGDKVPGFGEGQVTDMDDTLPVEAPDPDPLLALVVLLALVEGVLLLIANWWPGLFVVLAVVGLAFLIPDPQDVGGGLLPTIIALPFRPVRTLFSRLAAVFKPELGKSKKLRRVQYLLDLQRGTENTFVAKGQLKPSAPQKDDIVRVWTVQRRNRHYLRRAYIIDNDSKQAIPLQLHRSYAGRYALFIYLLQMALLIALFYIRLPRT